MNFVKATVCMGVFLAALLLLGTISLAQDDSQIVGISDDLIKLPFPLITANDPEVRKAIEAFNRKDFGDETESLASWKKVKLVYAEAYGKSFAREFEAQNQMLQGSFPWREVYNEFALKISKIRNMPSTPWDKEFWDIRYPLRQRAIKMKRPDPASLIGQYYPRPVFGLYELNLGEYQGYSSKIDVARRLRFDFVKTYVGLFAREFEESRGLPFGTFYSEDLLAIYLEGIQKLTEINIVLDMANPSSFLYQSLVDRANLIDQMGWALVEKDIVEKLERLAHPEDIEPQNSPATELINSAENLLSAVERATSGAAIEASRSLLLDVVQLSKFQRKIWFLLAFGFLASVFVIVLSGRPEKRK